MSYYAKIEENMVVAVISISDEMAQDLEGFWLKTSYRTYGNVHYGADGKPDGGVALRGNYAGVGFSYDPVNDVFIPPKPYPSWVLNPQTWLWEAPIPYPKDGKFYEWDETTQSWQEIPIKQTT